MKCKCGSSWECVCPTCHQWAPSDEWISVKDQLPPMAGYEYCKSYRIWDGFEIIAYWHNGQWTEDCIQPYVTYHPTHWMEKSEPPK